jgi:hypothetical protein
VQNSKVLAHRSILILTEMGGGGRRARSQASILVNSFHMHFTDSRAGWYSCRRLARLTCPHNTPEPCYF